MLTSLGNGPEPWRSKQREDQTLCRDNTQDNGDTGFQEVEKP